jgi:hypothetical protein
MVFAVSMLVLLAFVAGYAMGYSHAVSPSTQGEESK